jgi:hypothetical protein
MNKIRFIKMVLDAYILVAFVVLIFVSFQARLPLPKVMGPLFIAPAIKFRRDLAQSERS